MSGHNRLPLPPHTCPHFQQTPFAFLLSPKARAKGRFLSVSRQAQWGLQTLNYLEAKEREHAPEAAALAQALRGLKSFKLFLMTLVRNTTCLNEVMRIVKTQGLSTASIQACQERLGDLPARSPIRKEVSHYLQHYVPMVALSESPLLGSSDVIESLIGKAKPHRSPIFFGVSKISTHCIYVGYAISPFLGKVDCNLPPKLQTTEEGTVHLAPCGRTFDRRWAP